MTHHRSRLIAAGFWSLWLVIGLPALAWAQTQTPPKPSCRQSASEESSCGESSHEGHAEKGKRHGCGNHGGDCGHGAAGELDSRRPGMHGKGKGRMGGGRHGVMRSAMSLVHEYRDVIEREVVEIENGVITTTVSGDPEAAEVLSRHVAEMKGLIESGGRVRAWDPLFREIFDHYQEIDMTVETVAGGVRVTETSENPEVAKLIKAHARKVGEFVARGPAAVHESTPLPDGYVPRSQRERN